jgi:3-phosphoshikimate 1-carboxyvinyltransferase
MADKPAPAIPLSAARSPWLRGSIKVPGDRVVSRLVLILAALARGETIIERVSASPDISAMVTALRQLGVSISVEPGKYVVQGAGPTGLLAPDGVIELGALGDSGLLLISMLGVQDFETRFAGYSPTPMGEALLDFLNRTGSRIERSETGITTRGPRFALPLDLKLPREAMGLKAPLLLASLVITGTSFVHLPGENDLSDGLILGFGGALTTTSDDEGTRIAIDGMTPLKSQHFVVPGDPVFAAFPAVAALIAADSEIAVETLSISPERMVVIDALKLMGADIAMAPAKEGGRDTADLVAKTSKLKGILIRPDFGIEPEDLPILAVAAAFAKGETLFDGLGEGLRRLNLSRALRANGIECEERPNGLAVTGGQKIAGGGTVTTRGDAKLAMAFLVLGLGADKPVSIDDGAAMAEMFPDFVRSFEHVGCRFIAGTTP